MENVLELIHEDLLDLERAIDGMLTTRVPFIKTIVNHIIQSGGKRIRPVLLILAAKQCGYRGNKHIPYAAIIEFIHTSTLLHDDVVDNAATRRGSSTANTIWGNEATVLVGDFLFSKSFDLMVEGENTDILRIMSRTTTNLAEGEILELLHTADADTTEETYLEIIQNKTAVLFSAACRVGAILGGADSALQSAFATFGNSLGMAFQLTDDILDYTSKDTVLGKRVGTDLNEGKVTLPVIFALRHANDSEKEQIGVILQKNKATVKDFAFVRQLVERYGGISYTESKAEEFTVSATTALNSLQPSAYRNALFTLTESMLKRKA